MGPAEELFPLVLQVSPTATVGRLYLPQGALHGPQEVSITEAVVPRADVVQFKAEPLDLLEVVVHQEDLGEDRTTAAANHLCAVHLQTQEQMTGKKGSSRPRRPQFSFRL